MPKKITTKEFKSKGNKVHNNFFDYSLSEYIDAKSNVTIICPDHGIFKQIAGNHLSGQGCRLCGYKNISEFKLSNGDEFIKKSEVIHNKTYDYSLVEYKDSRTKIKIICLKHGVFEQIPNSHLSGAGCPKCGKIKVANERKKSKETFILDGNLVHDNKYRYPLVDYKNAHTKVKIFCPIDDHGYFEQTPHNHLQGYGCPKCKESKGEKEVRKYLLKTNLIFIPQHRFKDCRDKYPLPFDFYLPNHNVCIEFNGRQHYVQIDYFGGANSLLSTQKRDKIKAEYCKKNNIKLIVIKHTDDMINLLSKKLKLI